MFLNLISVQSLLSAACFSYFEGECKENSSNKRLCSLCSGNLGPLLKIAGFLFESLFAMSVSLPPFPSQLCVDGLVAVIVKC